MSYTIDFRRKVISVRKAEGLTIRETAKQFRIGKACLNDQSQKIQRHVRGSSIKML
ncbi:hypothetical protein [Candidatus Arsenophonus triatominarum]|uniref:hypothetical protein n=1 Tax=Candidatus Arsenophonus triatominarum TaxID=57911 RepID=UPI001C9C57BB|nr:hypothetical protein [Candidatus Arsenophonus triatominarum]